MLVSLLVAVAVVFATVWTGWTGWTRELKDSLNVAAIGPDGWAPTEKQARRRRSTGLRRRRRSKADLEGDAPEHSSDEGVEHEPILLTQRPALEAQSAAAPHLASLPARSPGDAAATVEPASLLTHSEGTGYSSRHDGTYLGRYASGDRTGRSISEAQARCNELGDDCAGITCHSEVVCTVRAGHELHASPIGEFSYLKEAPQPECRSELPVVQLNCSFDRLPLVGDEYLTVDWSLDAPEPPILGCNLPGAMFAGSEQYRCEKLLHIVRMEFLYKVTQFLKKSNVSYVLGFGTLLGSYRHGTIAWWDDDAGIVVQEEDSEKIKQLSKRASREYGGFGVIWWKSYKSHLAAKYLQPRHPRKGLMRFLQARMHLDPNVTTWPGCPPPKKSKIYIDMLVMSPVRFPLETGLLDTGLYTFGHDELYSYADIFPTKECWLGGFRFSCPHRTRVVLTRMYKNIGLAHSYSCRAHSCSVINESNRSKCELRMKEDGSLDPSKWRPEPLSGEYVPDMPLLREKKKGKTKVLTVDVPQAYEEELRQATKKWKKTVMAQHIPSWRAGCDWLFVMDLGGFRRNTSNSKCRPTRGMGKGMGKGEGVAKSEHPPPGARWGDAAQGAATPGPPPDLQVQEPVCWRGGWHTGNCSGEASGQAPGPAACRSELPRDRPDCGHDHLPLVAAKYLSVDWSLDAPEPPILGCDLPRAVFTGLEQYRCEKLLHVVRMEFVYNVTQFLKERNMSYVLGYGTLLGSYRHGTIAWWDDDADLVVREEDSETLRRLSGLASKEYGFKFSWWNTHRHDYYELASEYLQPRWSHPGCSHFLRARSNLKSAVTTPPGCPKPGQKSEIYIDIFLMSPIRFQLNTGLLDTGLYTFGHDELYSYADIFPAKECWLGGFPFACPRRTRVVLTRMYKNLELIHKFQRGECKLRIKKAGGLRASKWRSERLSRESFPDMPLLRRSLEGNVSTLIVNVPQAYEEELRVAKTEWKKGAEVQEIPSRRADCDWLFVKNLNFTGFRKNASNSMCWPASSGRARGKADALQIRTETPKAGDAAQIHTETFGDSA